VVRSQLIYRVTPKGDFEPFPMPAKSMATFITRGPDETLWFTEPNGKVGRISTAGDVREYVFSDPSSVQK